MEGTYVNKQGGKINEGWEEGGKVLRHSKYYYNCIWQRLW